MRQPIKKQNIAVVPVVPKARCTSCLKKNMNASKSSNRSKCLVGGKIGCRDKSSTWY